MKLMKVLNDLPISIKNSNSGQLETVSFNYSANQLVITNSKGIESIKIYNIYGKLIQQENGSAKIIDLNISDKGIYFIEIISANHKNQVKKIIISK